MKTILEHVRATRETEFAPAQTILDLAESETRDLTDVESAEIREIALKVKPLDERIAELDDLEKRNTLAAASPIAPFDSVVRSEPLTYSRYSSSDRVSYFRDLAALTPGINFGGSNEARARLDRHAQEMDVELITRAKRREANAEREVRNVIGYDAPNPFEKRVNPNRTDGTGGYLVPPVWLMDDLIPILRAGRTVANQVRSMDLPDGTDSINIPKLSTGTTAAIQTADAAAPSSTDFTDTSVSAGVKTIAGQQDVAIQLLDQSPINVDQIVFADIIADYNKKVDLQVISGSGSSGQMTGLYSSAGASSWTGYSSVSYTDASPTVAEFWAPLAQSMSKIAQARFNLSGVKVFMHPRRWFWLVGGLDSNNRPLVVPTSMNGFNQLGTATAPEAEGYVGNLVLGAPVFIDANMPTADTAGSGSAQDVMFTLKSDDAILFEGQLRQRTLPEVLSGTLQVRFQIYNYLAFLVRYGEALAIASGTGFSAPSGY